jgi:hypothetical protein
MIDFKTWCQEKGLDLPTVTTTEDRKRTGAKEGLYPPQYYAGQYPALWKTPAAADSAYYQSINKKS